MTREPTIVLLHGAGTGAWVWERVIRELRKPALALEVPGRTVDATPDRCATALAAEIDRRGAGPVVLVLHSLAGVLAPALSARLGSRLVSCVFVSAIVPPPGGAMVDALGLPQRLMLRVLFRLNPKGLKPSAAMIRRSVCNDLTEADAELVVSRYEAEMPGLYLTPAGASPVPVSAYVRLTKDRSLSLVHQDRSIARLGTRRVHDLEAGHLAMLSAPAALATVIMREALPA